MPDRNFAAQIILNGRDRTARAFRSVLSGLNSIKARTVAIAASITAALTGIGGGNIFGAAVSASANFEQALDRVFAKTSDLNDQLKNDLTETAKELGRTTRFTATEAANGFEILAQAGFTASEQMSALPAVLDTAITANVGLAESARFVADTLTVFGKSADQAGNVADVLAKGSLIANTNITQLARSVNEAGQVSDAAGLSLEGVAAAALVLANNGIRGERSATALRSILARLANDSGPTRTALRELGIDTSNFGEAIRQIGELDAPRLNKALLSFDQEALPAISALVKAGVSGFKEFEDQLKNVDGVSKQVAKEINDNLTGATISFKSALEGLFIAIVNQDVLDTLKGQVQGVTDQLRAAASSEAVGKFSKVLVDTFKQAGEAIQRFLSNFDFQGAIDKLSEFSSSFSEKLTVVSKTANVAGNSIKLFFNIVQTGFAALVTAVASPLAVVAIGIRKLAESLESIGVISEEALRRIENRTQVIEDVFNNAAEQTVKNAREVGEAWEGVGESLGIVESKVSGTTESISNGAKIAALAFDDVGLAAEKAAIKTSESMKNVKDQTNGAKQAAFDLRTEFEKFGLKTQEQLNIAADAALNLFEQTKANGANIKDQQKAYEAYADAARKAAENATEGEKAILEARLKTLEPLKQSQSEQRKITEETDKTEQAQRRYTSSVQETTQAQREATAAAQEDAKAKADAAAASGFLNQLHEVLEARLAGVSAAAKDAYGIALTGGAEQAGDAIQTTTEKLTAANDRIIESMRLQNSAANGVFTQIAGFYAQIAAEIEASALRQQGALESLIDSAKQGNQAAAAQLQSLGTDLEDLKRRFDLVDDATLQGVINQVRQLNSEIDQSADKVTSLRERLASLRGDEIAAQELRNKREVLELEKELQAARERGNREEIRNLEEALRLQKQINKEELSQLKQREEEDRRGREPPSRTPRKPRGPSQPRQPELLPAATPTTPVAPVDFTQPVMDIGNEIGGKLDRFVDRLEQRDREQRSRSGGLGGGQPIVVPIRDQDVKRAVFSGDFYTRFVEPEMQRRGRLRA